METFGKIKNRITKQLTDAYIAKDKKEIKSIINLIKENKDFLEVFKLYDIVEEKYFDDKEVAKLYVEEVAKLLSNKQQLIQRTCNKFTTLLTESIVENNNLYDALDQLLGTDDIRSLDKKLVAKKNVVNFLTQKKPEEQVSKVQNFTENQTLLSTILINNFNSKYTELLDEEEKDTLKEIMSMSSKEVEDAIEELKESINEKIEGILNENSNPDLKIKINGVKSRLETMDTSRLSYYKIKQLEKDL